jgi:hypothetical protein
VAQVKITVNGDPLVDRDLGEWTQSVPELEKYLDPNSKPTPWMQATLVCMTLAIVRNQPFTAEITSRSGSWDLHVETPD